MTVARAARDLGVHGNVLRRWVCAADAQPAFPGQGLMKPDQLEIERLRREVTKLKAERDIAKTAAEKKVTVPVTVEGVMDGKPPLNASQPIEMWRRGRDLKPLQYQRL